MLWGFEALRVFCDKLNKALEQVNSADSRMKTWLEKVCQFRSPIRYGSPPNLEQSESDPQEQGRGNRHKDMVSGAEQVKEEFEKRHSRLKNAHSSLKQRIDQGTKLREGVSSPI